MLKLQDITAGLLAVLLFCGTAWGGVCPLRCELRRGIAVAQQGAGYEGMAMPRGHCHGMTGAAAKDMVSIGCAVVPCGHGEVSAAVADEGYRTSFGLTQPMTVLVEMVVVQGPQWAGARRGEAERPPRMSVGFDPLMVALRV